MSYSNVFRLLVAALKSGERMVDLTTGDVLYVLPGIDDYGSINIGNGTYDMDVKVFLGASTSYIEMNVGDGQVNIEGAELHLGDNDAIEFGDATAGDVTLAWDGGDLVFLPAVDDTGKIEIGNAAGTLAMDLVWYGDTTGDLVTFDNSTDSCTFEDIDLTFNDAYIQMGDNDEIRFGDAAGGDVSIYWDTGDLVIRPITDDTGKLEIGLADASKNMDLVWYSTTSGDNVTFDASGSLVTFTDIGLTLNGALTVTTPTLAAEHGAGAIGTGVAPTTKRYVLNGTIITEIKVDLQGLTSKNTANDVIGLAAGGNAYIGRYVVATNGIIYKIELICLETPAGGDDDVNLVANASGTLAYDDAGGTAYGVDGGDAVAGQVVQDLVQGLTANDYFYLTAGTGDTAAAYTAGQFLIRIYGHPVLT